ncbi:Transcriptional regulator, AbiEi antitoxin, Type IV TA system [Nocardioides scoriae]|uniref:Transcriptional regulator, AbiEi antitoxin, Type IV TA system n=1 Tax=Nocardioides scoriae TaxID=642780 RepID=A0A1H1WJ46_9ACTN|nr:type IV toxin-antitoxin system AbiEi family antitoxin domain-containing protein [Nocardioides scoriae]SDS97153.1 Transcriptional regulator, AbiEi antitoxin, Type IV TA system [Nocardioides scoriae]
MDELARISQEQGVFLRREAIAAGADDAWLARARRSGVIHRVRRGAYVPAEDWTPLDEAARHRLLVRAVLRTAGAAAVVSHVSAAAVWGTPLWDLPLTEVHLTRLDGRAGRREAGVVQHCGRLGEEETVQVGPYTVTTPARTALDLFTLTDVEHALCVTDHLLHSGRTTAAELRRARTLMRRTPGMLAADLLVALADARSESVGETRSRHMFWRQGLPAPIPQFEVRDGRGRVVAVVDFAWPAYALFVEFDGFVKYEKLLAPGQSASQVVVAEKQRESLVCRLTGWRCHRLVWADLHRPAETCRLLRSLMTVAA